MILLGHFQAAPYHLDVAWRGFDTFLWLLLKTVKDINKIRELHCVNGAICITVSVSNLHHGGTVETLERLGVDVLAPELRMVQSLAGDRARVLRKASWGPRGCRPRKWRPSPSFLRDIESGINGRAFPSGPPNHVSRQIEDTAFFRSRTTTSINGGRRRSAHGVSGKSGGNRATTG
jgi:hypothetical protein